MSCIYKIKEGMGSFTDTEKKLAEYILENKIKFRVDKDIYEILQLT